MKSGYEDVWLVIPLYNEACVIGEVITQALEVFPNIVCIDDGSTDGSGQAALSAGATVIAHPINLGQGASLQTGFEYVLGQTDANYAITFDADGQHLVKNAVDMVKRARQDDLAVVFGSRFLAGPVEASAAKRLVLKTAAFVTRIRTGLRLTDAHNGLRLLRCDALKAINLTQNRMAHASQIVDQIAKSKLSWAEMPVQIKYTDYSKSKGQSLLNSVNILVDLILH